MQPPNKKQKLDLENLRIEEDFKTNSYFKNSICKITANLTLNLSKLICFIGGQYTKSIPAVRSVFCINSHRYSILIYSKEDNNNSTINLTNVFFIYKPQEVFDFINNFFIFCIINGIGVLKSDELKIEYLIENCHFSMQLIPAQESLRFYGETDFQYNINLFKYFKTRSENEIFYKIVDEQTTSSSFPALIFKFTFERFNDEIIKFKSDASKKRHQHNFLNQTVSMHIFNNSKYIITGGQTKEDLNNIKHIIKLLFDYVFYSQNLE